MTKEELQAKSFFIVQLGCDKNRVDGEKMAYLLNNYGLKTAQTAEDANIIIINTCAFIQSAKEESIGCICDAINLKGSNCQKVIVTGCLAQRYFDEVKKGFPEVDSLLG